MPYGDPMVPSAISPCRPPRHALARRRLARLAFVGCSLSSTPAWAQQGPAASLEPDTFVSGSDVRLEAEVGGDAVLVGGSVVVVATVDGDGVAGGRDVELRGPFGSNVYAAGRSVRLDGIVAGNARLLGGSVTLGPETAVAGGVSIAAGSAEIDGYIGRYLQVAAGSTRVSGRVTGDLDVSGGELFIAPSADIDGRVLFRGPEPASVAPGARVGGEVLHLPSAPPPGPGQQLLEGVLFASAAALGLSALGAASATLWPRFSRGVIGIAMKRSGAALLAGLAATLVGPLAIALLSFTIVGLPLALFMACGYALSYPLGCIVAAAGIGERLGERTRAARGGGAAPRALTLVAALFAFGVLAMLPVIGPLSIAVLTLIGVGALVLESIERLQRRPRADPDIEAAVGPASQQPGDGDATLQT